MPYYYNPPRQPSFADQFGQGFGQGLSLYKMHQDMKRQEEESDYRKQNLLETQRERTSQQDYREATLEQLRKRNLMDDLTKLAPDNPDAATKIWNKEFASEYGVASFTGKKFTKYTDPKTGKTYTGEAFDWKLEKPEGGNISHFGLLRTPDGQIVPMQVDTGVAVPPKAQQMTTEADRIAGSMVNPATGKSYSGFEDPALPPAARAQILKEVEGRSTRIAAAGAAARGEVAQNQPLSPTEAGALGVPYGTTGRQAEGKTPLTTYAQNTITNMGSAKSVLTQMRGLLKEIKMPETPTDRAMQTPGRAIAGFTQADPAVVQMNALTEGMLAAFSRSVGGERGATTEGDTNRARNLVVKVYPIPDTREVAERKLAQLEKLIDEIEARARSGGKLEGGGNLPAGWTPVK